VPIRRPIIESSASAQSGLSLSEERLVDETCDRFEAAWKSGRQPDIRRYLAEAPRAIRKQLFQELLPLELTYRYQRGDSSKPGDYESRFPEFRQIIAEVFNDGTDHPNHEDSKPVFAKWAESARRRNPSLFAPFQKELPDRAGDTPQQSSRTPTPVEEFRSEGAIANDLGAYDIEPAIQGRAARASCPIFGDYELLAQIGRGGMGVVYRARQISADRIVALKVIRDDLLDDLAAEKRREYLLRFQREARTAARVQHENVVTVYDVGEVDGKHYYSMRYIEGRNLADVLRDHPISCRKAALYMRSIGRAVHAIHLADIVHRDLKPRNILVDQADTPFVADFGLAKWRDASDAMTRLEIGLGTPCYMSPEQAQNPAQVDRAGDVYSLGAILYEALAGRPPFRADDPLETLRQVVCKDPVAPTRLNPSVDRDLELICLKCLQKEPRARYQSADQVAEELDHYLKREPLAYTRPVSVANRLFRWCRRNPVLAGVSSLAALGLLAAAVLLVVFEVHRTAARADLAKKNIENQQDSAYWALDWGVNLCERGEIDQGVLWLARALKVAPPEAAPLRECINANFCSWRQRLNTLDAILVHDGPVLAVAFSSDGRKILTGSPDTTACLWDARTGHVLGLPFQHGGAVRAVAFTADGEKILTGNWDGTAQVWDARMAKPIGSPLKHQRALYVVAFSPDGKHALTGSEDHTARLWNSVTGQAAGLPLSHDGSIVSVAFSPDGSKVLTGGLDRNPRVWNAEVGQPLLQLSGHEDFVISVAFSPSGKAMLTGSKDNTARLWDAATGKPLTPPLTHQGAVGAVAFSPDGAYVLTGSGDKTARLWSAVNGKPIGAPVLHQGEVCCVAFSPDSQRFLTASKDGSVRLWWCDSQIPIGSPLHHQGPVPLAAFSPDGRRIITGNADGTARLWNVAPTDSLKATLHHTGAVYAVAFSPDGKILLTASFDLSAGLWDAATGKPLGRPLQHHERVCTAAFSPDGRSVVTGSYDKTAQLWNVGTGEPLAAPMRHDSRIYAVAFSPDSRTILTGSDDKTARLWDAATSQPRCGPLLHQGEVFAVAFSPDGKKVLTGSGDNTAQIWDSATGEPLGPALAHIGPITDVAFSPSGKLAITASMDRTARIWDVASGSPIGQSLAHTDRVYKVRFSPDGRLVLTTSADRTAQLWDVGTGNAAGPPLEHGDHVYAGAFSPDGKLVATASADGSARCWHVATGKPVGPRFIHRYGVHRVAWSPDGNSVLTGGLDNTARLWQCPVLPQVENEWISVWSQVATGMELQQTGAARELGPRRWSEQRAYLQQLGGLP
jgi:WD40 repeat protein/serine/threonine protein kinase